MSKRRMNKKDIIQSVVSEILTRFMFCSTMEEVSKEWDAIYDSYELRDDPFTHTPCSAFEYFELSQEYERQLAEDRFYLL